MQNHFSFALLRGLLPVLALSSLPSTALANCAENAYMGQVCMVGATFCPSNTQGADGRLLNISEYEPLYALLGTTYGGDGATTFGLPNLNGRMPVGLGQGAGLGQSVAQGQLWGAENNALTTATMPAHIHTAISTLSANTTIGSAAAPSSANNALAGMAVQELTGSGVLLKIRVQENAPVTSFSFQGNQALSSEEIQKVFADQLGKPLLIEGPAGVGKTELARACAQAREARFVRLQCYEGIDEARALYEWNHAKQILRIQSSGGDGDWDDTKQDVRFWLNPAEQHTYKSGWFTVEELKQWAKGEGPILNVTGVVVADAARLALALRRSGRCRTRGGRRGARPFQHEPRRRRRDILHH